MLLIHHHPWFGKFLHPPTTRQVPRKLDQGGATCTYFIVNTKSFFISITDWPLETYAEYNTAGRSLRLVPRVRLNNSS
jgi:hypothetical protein